MTNSFEGQKVQFTQNSMGSFIKLKITSDTPNNLITDDIGTTYDFEFTNNQSGEFIHVAEQLAKTIPDNNRPVVEPEEGGGGSTGLISINAASPADFNSDDPFRDV